MLHESDLHTIRHMIREALEERGGMSASDLREHLRNLAKGIMQMAHTLTELESFRTLFAGIKQQLKDALAAQGQLTPEQEAIIDDTFNEAHGAAGEIADDIAANTDEPVPTVEPPPA